MSNLTEKRSSGLTLVEVLIALAVLAIGILSYAQLQGTSLRFTSQAEQIRIATQVAESEIDWRRRVDVDLPSFNSQCQSVVPEWLDCTVAIQPVGPNGFGISVTAEGRQASVTLSSFKTGQTYVAGNLPTTPVPPDDGSDDEPGDGDVDPGVDPPVVPVPCYNPQGKEIPCKKK